MPTIKQTKLLRPSATSCLKKYNAYSLYPSHLSLEIPSNNLNTIMKRRFVCRSLELITENRKTSYLLKLLKKFHKVASLKLDVAYSFKFNDGDLFKVTRCLKSNFKWLKELEFCAANAHSKLTNSGISKLTKRMTKLSKITFDFSRLERLDDAGMVRLGKNVAKMSQTSEFHLNISECENISDKGIISLAQSLEQRPELKRLTLSLLNCSQINKEGIKACTNAIQSLQSLTHLQFDASSYLDDTTWTGILNNMKKLENLTYFGSKFEMRPITDKKLEELSAALNKFNKLQSLSIILLVCYEIKDKGLSDFCHNLAQIQTLKRLYLKIERTEELTDNGIELLSQHISQMKNLESLTLGFSFYTGLTNRGLMYLRKIPKNLNRLANLDFIFRSCNGMNTEGALSFTKDIYENSNIKQKKIDFIRCTNVNLEIQTQTNAI